MMIPQVYGSIWLVAVALAAVLYLTGNFSDLVLNIFSFIFATLFFGFFLAVLPWWVYKIHQPKYHNR